MMARKKKRVQSSTEQGASPIGQPRASPAGPTAERLAKAAGHFVVGDDKMGHRVYQFIDTPLARLYSRLVKASKGKEIDKLQTEYTALMKYRNHWHQAGLEASLPSVDPGRTYASDPTAFSGMAKTERQHDHRQRWRDARELLGHKPGIVVDNIVCAETSLEVAGWSIGFNSPFRAREGAMKILRDAGVRLAGLWGIG